MKYNFSFCLKGISVKHHILLKNLKKYISHVLIDIVKRKDYKKVTSETTDKTVT